MNNPIPAVSIVTPARDVAPYLGETIRSVLAQSHADFEHIIVDDGSTDETREIAESFSAADPRVRVAAQAPRGASAARNAALRLARAPLIAFLDGDDLWRPDFLKRSLAALTAEPADCIGTFCWSEDIAEDGRHLQRATAPTIGRCDAYEMLRPICAPGNGSCLVIRREPLFEAGLFDEGVASGQDIALWMEMLSRSSWRYVRCVHAPLVLHRHRSKSLSSTHRQERLANCRDILARHGGLFDPRQRAEIRLRFMRYAVELGSDGFARGWARQLWDERELLPDWRARWTAACVRFGGASLLRAWEGWNG